MWPEWVAYRDKQPPKPDAPVLTATPATPAPIIAPDVTTSVLGTEASASEEPQQLILVSTSVGANRLDSTASLGTDARNPQTYALGAILSNGATISEIHADRIVLSLGGKRTTLAADPAAAGRAAMHDTLAQSKSASPTVLASLNTPANSSAATTIGGPDAVKRPVDRVPSSRDEFADIMRSQVVFERDKVAGFQIFAGNRAGALGQLGLQEGDIVRSVEGKPVVGESAMQAIDDAVSTGASIVVGVERDGSLLSVSLDGGQLTDPQPASPPPMPIS
jgi:type II secretory pathway component PulC